MTIRNTVQNILSKDLEIEFDKTFEKTWNAFKENMGSYFLYTLVCILFCCMIFGIFIGPVLVLGFSTYSREVAVNGRADFNAFFKPFQKFGPLFVVSILFFIINLLISYPLLSKMLPLYVEMLQHIDDKEAIQEIAERMNDVSPLSSYYTNVVQFVIAVFTFYAPYLIYYGDYGVIEALDVSVQLVTKKFALILFMFFIAAVIKYGGLILCCVGIFFTVPYAYIFYHEVFNLSILEKADTSAQQYF